MTLPTVAEYLTHRLQVSEKTQRQVAEEVGYPSPNIITMMKRGQTKVPLEKVPALARVLDVDPIHFLRIAMIEYAPEVWKVIEETLGIIVTRNEWELISALREATDNADPPIDPEFLREIGKLVESGTRR